MLPFMTYHLLYWFEKAISSHSVFNWEALTYCGDAVYMRKRKSYAWMKWYGKRTLPPQNGKIKYCKYKDHWQCYWYISSVCQLVD